MLIFFSLAYLTVGLRPIVVIPNATALMLQGWAVQWGLFIAFAAFFMVFWAIRIFNKEFFSGRSQWGALIPLIGLGGYAILIWLAVLSHPYVVVHGFVSWIAPNLGTYYGIGFTVLATVSAVFYLALVPLISIWLWMRTRRGLGQKVFMKDMMMWLGLLLIFVGILADFLTLFITPLTFEIVGIRAVILVGFILLWFGYRLANLFLK
ncbi:MAG: hypothetical protein ACFE9O_01900 [Promethearchaeota archaeon]